MPQIPGARHRSPGPVHGVCWSDSRRLTQTQSGPGECSADIYTETATPDPSSGGETNWQRAGNKNVFGRLRERYIDYCPAIASQDKVPNMDMPTDHLINFIIIIFLPNVNIWKET